MFLTGKFFKAALEHRARRARALNRRRPVVEHEVRPNVPIVELPTLRVAEPEAKVGGTCPKCGRVFKGPNVPHFHLRSCAG